MPNQRKPANMILKSIVLFCAFLAALPYADCYGQQAVALEMLAQPDGSSGRPDAEISFSINGSGLQALYAFELTIEYDPMRLEFVHAEMKLDGLTVKPAAKGGKLLLSHTRIGPVSGASGNFQLGIVRFKRIVGGDTSLRLSKARLVDDRLNQETQAAGTPLLIPASSPAVSGSSRAE